MRSSHESVPSYRNLIPSSSPERSDVHKGWAVEKPSGRGRPGGPSGNYEEKENLGK